MNSELTSPWMKSGPKRFPKYSGTFCAAIASNVRARMKSELKEQRWTTALTAQQWTSRDREALDRGRPSRLQAEDAVRTLISWAGDDPTPEGLLDTPERVARAYEEWFAGYNEVPSQLLELCFEEIAGYDEILLRDIRFESHS